MIDNCERYCFFVNKSGKYDVKTFEGFIKFLKEVKEKVYLVYPDNYIKENFRIYEQSILSNELSILVNFLVDDNSNMEIGFMFTWDNNKFIMIFECSDGIDKEKLIPLLEQVD